jgi:hypothetical protein
VPESLSPLNAASIRIHSPSIGASSASTS